MKEHVSTEPIKTISEEKKEYMKPTLKRYTTPRLRKHKSYKDITMLFAIFPTPS